MNSTKLLRINLNRFEMAIIWQKMNTAFAKISSRRESQKRLPNIALSVSFGLRTHREFHYLECHCNRLRSASLEACDAYDASCYCFGALFGLQIHDHKCLVLRHSLQSLQQFVQPKRCLSPEVKPGRQ